MGMMATVTLVSQSPRRGIGSPEVQIWVADWPGVRPSLNPLVGESALRSWDGLEAELANSGLNPLVGESALRS